MTRVFFRDTVLAWIVALVGTAILLRWAPKGWYQTLVFGAVAGALVGLAQSRHLGQFVAPKTWVLRSAIGTCAACVVGTSIVFVMDPGLLVSVLIGAIAGALIAFAQVTSILHHVRTVGPWLKACALALGTTGAVMRLIEPLSDHAADPQLVLLLLGGVLFAGAEAWLFRNLVERSQSPFSAVGGPPATAR